MGSFRFDPPVVIALPREIPALLDTLAAAYATCGQLNDALRTARRAVDLARTNDDPSLPDILACLSMYESSVAGQ